MPQSTKLRSQAPCTQESDLSTPQQRSPLSRWRAASLATLFTTSELASTRSFHAKMALQRTLQKTRSLMSQASFSIATGAELEADHFQAVGDCTPTHADRHRFSTLGELSMHNSPKFVQQQQQQRPSPFTVPLDVSGHSDSFSWSRRMCNDALLTYSPAFAPQTQRPALEDAVWQRAAEALAAARFASPSSAVRYQPLADSVRIGVLSAEREAEGAQRFDLSALTSADKPSTPGEALMLSPHLLCPAESS